MKKAVFGMGIALINHWNIIKEKFNPDFVIDNNPKKWGKVDNYTGLMCKSLEKICFNESDEVLITVGDPYAINAISKQLTDLNVKFKVLVDQFDEWYQNLPLPDHLDKMKKEEKKIVLFNTPEHDNVGDHLITLAEMQFIKQNINEYSVYEVTDIEFLKHHLKIKEVIDEDDIILITGGGYAGSLWLYNGEDNIREIIKEYPQNQIVMMPQTVFFEENDRGKNEYLKSKSIYQSHDKLILCAREKMSYNLFVDLKGASEGVYLIPDMALFYDADYKIEKDNRLAIICLRNDKEGVLDSDERKQIINAIKNRGYEIKEISMHSGLFDGIEGRDNQVKLKLEEIASAQVVVTDTLHCMISSALVGTNCLAFNNISCKVKNVYQWIKELGYVYICEDTENFEKHIERIEQSNSVNKYEFLDINEYKHKLTRIIKGSQLC